MAKNRIDPKEEMKEKRGKMIVRRYHNLHFHQNLFLYDPVMEQKEYINAIRENVYSQEVKKLNKNKKSVKKDVFVMRLRTARSNLLLYYQTSVAPPNLSFNPRLLHLKEE